MGTKDERLDALTGDEKPRGGRGTVPEKGGGRSERTSLRSNGDRPFLSRFQTPPYLIRNASHGSSDLFPPFLGIILYIDPRHPLWTLLRRVASHQHRVCPLSPFAISPTPRSSEAASGAASLLENSRLFEFLTRHLPPPSAISQRTLP